MDLKNCEKGVMMTDTLMMNEEFLRSILEDEERKLWRDVAIAAVNCPGDEIEARHAIMWADEITAAYMDKFDKKTP